MNLGNEILFCFSRCAVLIFLSAYADPSMESKQIDSCSRMRDIGYSIMTTSYAFTGINAILIIFYCYLLAKHLQIPFEVQLLIKINFQDVIMFVMLSINGVALSFVYDSHCGEYAHRMVNMLTLYWIIMCISGFFGYFIYNKIFITIQQQINQQQQQQLNRQHNGNARNNHFYLTNGQNDMSNQNENNNNNNTGDLEMVLLGI